MTTANRNTRSDAPASPRYAEHLCLVSDQATPNLTPLLDPQFAPEKVTLVVTDQMQRQADRLASVVQPRGIKVERLAVANAWDIPSITQTIIDWLDPRAEARVALNVTGGTKPMAIAAQQAFAMAGKPVFYVQQADGLVQWLSTESGGSIPSHRLNSQLKLESYLGAHGWQVEDRPRWPQQTRQQRELTDTLVIQVGSLAAPLGTLNYIAAECSDNKTLHAPLTRSQAADPNLDALLRMFENAGMLRRNDLRLSFTDEAARTYCNGGWLEQHVAAVVAQLQGRGLVQDCAANLRILSQDNTLDADRGRNELDVALIARNRLHLIECKTRRFQAKDSASDAVYKLDSLTGVGGSNTRGMLISYRPLRDGDTQRAKDLRIRTVIGEAIRNLENTLQQWIERG